MVSTASEASSLRRMTITGAQLAYNDVGLGRPLVLVHANISAIRSWDSVTPLLAKKVRVVAYSRQCAWPNDEISDKAAVPWEDHAEDLEAMIEKLDIAPAHLLGNSTGAAVAFILAIKRPDLVKSLILEEPPLISLFLPITPPSLMDIAKLLWLHPWWFLPTIYFGATVISPGTNAFKRGHSEAASKIFSRGILGYEFDQRLSNARRKQMRNNAKPHRALLCCGEMPKILDSDVYKPALVVTGEMTVLSQRHINRRLAVLLSNPREIEVRNESHLMHEDQPEEVVHVVVESVFAMSRSLEAIGIIYSARENLRGHDSAERLERGLMRDLGPPPKTPRNEKRKLQSRGNLASRHFGIGNLSAPEIRECDEMCSGKSEIHVDSWYTTLSLCVFW